MSERIDCWCTELLVCPLCGYREPDSWEINVMSKHDKEVTCSSCGGTFLAWSEQTTYYYSQKRSPTP